MNETPKCPYCGAEMQDDSYTWTCPKCYSNSPVVIWDEEKVKGMTEEKKMAYAREAALRRAEPENRVLMLEELVGMANKYDWEIVWVECRLTPKCPLTQECPGIAGEHGVWFVTPGKADDIFYAANRYNKFWRCWPQKPTPEQMAAEKWEE